MKPEAKSGPSGFGGYKQWTLDKCFHDFIFSQQSHSITFDIFLRKIILKKIAQNAQMLKFFSKWPSNIPWKIFWGRVLYKLFHGWRFTTNFIFLISNSFFFTNDTFFNFCQYYIYKLFWNTLLGKLPKKYFKIGYKHNFWQS